MEMVIATIVFIGLMTICSWLENIQPPEEDYIPLGPSPSEKSSWHVEPGSDLISLARNTEHGGCRFNSYSGIRSATPLGNSPRRTACQSGSGSAVFRTHG